MCLFAFCVGARGMPSQFRMRNEPTRAMADSLYAFFDVAFCFCNETLLAMSGSCLGIVCVVIGFSLSACSCDIFLMVHFGRDGSDSTFARPFTDCSALLHVVVGMTSKIMMSTYTYGSRFGGLSVATEVSYH